MDKLKTFAASRAGRSVLLGLSLVATLFFLGRGCMSTHVSPDNPMTQAPDRQPDLPPSPTGFQDSLPAAGHYRALVESYGDRVGRTEGELTRARTEIEGLKAELARERQSGRSDMLRIDRILDDLKNSIQPSPAGSQRVAVSPAAAPSKGGTAANPSFPSGGNYDTHLPLTDGAGGQAHPRASLRVITFNAPRAEAEKKAPRSVHIPSGSTALAVVTNGVFAPTNGEPSPVRLYLQTDLRGPNGTSIPLGEAFMIGKAQGNANSQRVTVEIDRMSFVSSSGRSRDAQILAYVVDHDGLEGIPGDYQWRAAELLPLAVGASGLTAAAQALAAAETVTTVSPLGGAAEFVTGDAAKYAALQGTAGGSRKLEDMVVERMREIRPAIMIGAHRRVTVVFLESVTLEGLDPNELESEKPHDPFTGLDLHR